METIYQVINLVEKYGSFSNCVLTFITICISLYATSKTICNSKDETKRNKEQYDEYIRKVDNLVENQLNYSEDVRRLQEKPYLVFENAEVSDKSDNGSTIISMVFRNSGRGSAYDLKPALKSESLKNAGKELSRYDAIRNPIAMVGEQITTVYSIESKELIDGFETQLTFTFGDASGRKYRQTFDLVINSTGDIDCPNSLEPELIESYNPVWKK